jgi:hypothetical protein
MGDEHGEPGAPLRPEDPRNVGPYALERLLGAGGMGTVYLARAVAGRHAGRRVAVKVVNAHLRADPLFRRRFAHEVEAASRVASFCTAQVLDADAAGPVPYLVTEFVAGRSLHDHVTASGPLSASDVDALAVGVAAALTAIHTVGLVHGDLTPSNVLLSSFGPKVIDFGVARLVENARPQTRVAFGTPGWLAPEQLDGRPPGPASDVFVWGLLVAWASTGRSPFATGRRGTKRAPHGRPDLAGLPPRLAGVVDRALHPDPRARPTARDVLLSLVGRADTASVRAAVTPVNPVLRANTTERLDPPPAFRPARRRGRGVRRFAAFAGTMLLGLMLLVALRTNAGSGTGAGSDAGARTAAPAPAKSTSAPKKAPPAKARTGRDGKLQFNVVDLRCGETELGTWPLTKQAQGQFCLLKLTVTGIGKDAGHVWFGAQKLFDASGREYKADDFSFVYLDDSRPLTADVNPGNVVTGVLVFDAPAGVRFTRLVVHDSPFSRGTSITLG